MRVFVVKVPERFVDGQWIEKFMLAEAEKFGEVIRILGKGNNYIVNEIPVIQEALKDFTEDDFLILAGSPLQMGIAAYIAIKKTEGRMKFLVWDNLKKTYSLEAIYCGD